MGQKAIYIDPQPTVFITLKCREFHHHDSCESTTGEASSLGYYRFGSPIILLCNFGKYTDRLWTSF